MDLKNAAILSIATLIVGVFIWSIATEEPPAHYHPVTHCMEAEGVEQPQALVFIDPSSPFSPQQSDFLIAFATYLTNRALDKNTHLSLYKLQEKVTVPPVPELSICYPGPVKRLMGAIPKKAAEAFKTQFNTAIQSFLETNKGEKTSPLIEGLTAVFQSTQWRAEKRQVIIMSDMLQNTAGLLSNYGKRPYFPTFAQFYKTHKRYLDSRNINLTGVDIKIFQIYRAPLSNQRQIEKSQDFWADFFKHYHAQSVSFCSLDVQLNAHCVTRWQQAAQ